VDPSNREAAAQLALTLNEIVEIRAAPGRDLTLVRPDGYIAYAATHHAGGAALQSIRALLERQTQSNVQAGAGDSKRTTAAYA
jgi:hypothetical protein